ncbi:MAG: NfeD family protein [Candidatus Jordarchaeum sp.]|uniref:NfeD family protein n=1 Tax=Candidatus Jordarchaeum sp. TaxID=2823881 RepID=UPI00404AC59B
MALDPWVISLLASITFLGLGILLIILEAKLGIGILAVGGIACVAIAVIILFRIQNVPDEYVFYVDILKYTIMISGIVLSVFFGYIAYKGYQTKKLAPKLEAESLIGKIGIAKTDIDPKGQVNLEGELWSAVCKQKPYAYEGEEVEVIGFEGLTLIVRPGIYKKIDQEMVDEKRKKTSKWKKSKKP